ncbi:GntR family transcriptional regulator [Roseiarcus fermentans]|uniref:GntR family transcriptional regulator n=1 Tax=Roseiarcus fermentans TaxID=1473586 RepID=A0A366FTU4_9HYPH|nr:FCD domain-containing protein [Roseiarcus fermentans]RBP18104.1 GntR family transcriptional regulator [Roseiarcus fermentans]
MLEGVEPLSRSEGSLAEELVRRIEALILERRAEGNTRLGSKEELRQTFQVAHGTMNEAMRVLETRGLVELRRGPQGGVFVAPPSIFLRLSNVFLGFRKNSESIQDCLAVRDQLEVLTAVEAAKTAPSRPDDVKELYRLFDRMAETVDEPQVTLTWNWELHRCISRMGANKILSGIYLTLLDYIEQELDEVAAVPSPGRSQRILKMHRDIIDAIASGDVERTAAATRYHPLPPEEGSPAEPGPSKRYDRKAREP